MGYKNITRYALNGALMVGTFLFASCKPNNGIDIGKYRSFPYEQGQTVLHVMKEDYSANKCWVEFSNGSVAYGGTILTKDNRIIIVNPVAHGICAEVWKDPKNGLNPALELRVGH